MLQLLDPAVHLAYLVVTALAAGLQPLTGGASTAAAIVVSTLVVKACLVPLAVSAARAQRSRNALAPLLAKLRQKHRSDPARLAAEVRAMHERAGIRPLAGCLPALLQMPVLSVVYRLFVADTVAGQPNTLLVASLWGAPLGSSWPATLATYGVLGAPSVVVALVVVLMIAVAALTARQLATTVTAEGPAALVSRLMPFATVLVTAVLPLAAAVYLLTSSAWTVAERAALGRFLG